jgi:DNA repair protein RecN (Recombination protein N)
MLKSLYVKNYTLIEEIEVEFSGGLNILTGETGAGKSILIDALGLILGERASSDCVRHGSDKAIVEGVFSVDDNERARKLLRAEGYEDAELPGKEVIIRREFSARGTSRAFVNDSPAPLAFVKDLGDHLVDLHGQHDHQLLLKPETHVHLLDNAGGLDRIVGEYAQAYQELIANQDELRKLRQREEQLHEKQEFYQFQLREIDTVDPKPGEDESLQRDLKILENSERIYALTSQLHAQLYDQENSIRDQLLRARNLFDQLAVFDEEFSMWRSECISATAIVEEMAKHLQHYSAGIEFSPEKLEEMRERLFTLNGIRKKFGGSLEGVISYRTQIATEIELAQNFDEQIEKLERELAERQARAGTLAIKLSQKRREVARKIERAIETVLKQLGIDKGKFVVHIDRSEVQTESATAVTHNGTRYAANPHGIDRIEYFISTNLGEEPKPLARVASGGEISRVMLAMKTILAKNDKLPLLVFDEIDVGISGRIASKVGASMRDLADFHQIIAITHLPQIAAMSNSHFVAEKIVHGGRTTTQVRKLNQDEHTREVAKLMSGETVTESSLQMARELIEPAGSA